MSDNVAIRVNDLNKSFSLPEHRISSLKQWFINIGKKKKKHRQTVLSNVGFEIKAGEFFGIVGRNGSGKSTLLKILAGVYTPDSGSVEINGLLTPFIELGVGFNPELSGRDNVYLNGALLGFTRKQMDSMYDDIVAFAELEDHMDKLLKNYSSGMQVRLAFSIAIRADSDILLIDEVLAVGDAAFQQKCFDYFNKLKRTGKTVVFVSHDMDSVQRYCTKAIYVKDGVVSEPTKPSKVALEYAIDNVSTSDDRPIESAPKRSLSKLSGTAIITNFAVVSGRKEHIFKRNDVIDVAVSCKAKSEQSVACSISFSRDDGTYLAGYNSRNTLGEVVLKKNTEQKFTCKIPAGQLAKGAYKINAVIVDYATGSILDYRDFNFGSKVPTVSIIENDTSKDGLFNVAGSWIVD